MSRDFIHISPTPVEESCVQVGHSNYNQVVRQECYLFIRDLENQILKKWSDIKINLVTKSNPHDYGTYYEVVAYYDTEDKDSVDQAFFCESDAATTWSEEAQIEIDKVYKKYNIDFQHSDE